MQYWQFCVGLNQGASDRKGAFDWGQVTGVNDLSPAWRNGRPSDYSDRRAALLLMSL